MCRDTGFRKVSAAHEEEVDAVAAPADGDFRDGGLEGALELDAVGLGVVADDLEAFENGHALVPGGRLEGPGCRRSLMGADDTDRGAGAVHDQGRGASLGPDEGAVPAVELELERAGDAVDARREEEGAFVRGNPLAEFLGAVGHRGEVGELQRRGRRFVGKGGCGEGEKDCGREFHHPAA